MSLVHSTQCCEWKCEKEAPFLNLTCHRTFKALRNASVLKIFSFVPEYKAHKILVSRIQTYDLRVRRRGHYHKTTRSSPPAYVLNHGFHPEHWPSHSPPATPERISDRLCIFMNYVYRNRPNKNIQINLAGTIQHLVVTLKCITELISLRWVWQINKVLWVGTTARYYVINN